MGRSLEQLDDSGEHGHSVLPAGEIDSFCSSNPNSESILFWKLVDQIEQELQACAKIINATGPKPDLLEVFCHPDSTLSSQIHQLGGKSHRHGLNQGDLMKPEGRRQLFSTLLRSCPRRVWMSPVCVAHGDSGQHSIVYDPWIHGTKFMLKGGTCSSKWHCA